MIRWVILTLVLLGTTTGFPQDKSPWSEVRKRDEAKWAAQTGLSVFTVHQLWRLASHFASAADDYSRIELLDPWSLGRNHILLATYDSSDFCLNLTVFAKTKGYEKVWTEDQTPSGQGFCNANATVLVSEGRIVVRIPSEPARAEDGRPEFTQYEYGWNGNAYRFTGKKKLYGPVSSSSAESK